MSMVFSNNKFISTFVAVLFLALCFVGNSFAWDGYDHENNTSIEIGKGNLVREGEVIRFYDWEDEQDHKAEVKSVEELFNGTRLEVYDLDAQKDRVFDMMFSQ